jgi:hypothetical protein
MFYGEAKLCINYVFSVRTLIPKGRCVVVVVDLLAVFASSFKFELNYMQRRAAAPGQMTMSIRVYWQSYRLQTVLHSSLDNSHDPRVHDVPKNHVRP